jgi:hypothetical protein
MSNAIIDGTNIDLSVFSYSAPKANPTGGKVVNLYNKHAKEYLTIAAPLMGAWSAQEGKTDKGEPNGKYTMSLQFSKGEYATPETNKFLEQLKLLENKVKADAIIYSKEWFGKEVKSMEVMEEKFNSMLKYPKIKGSEVKNYDAPPSLTIKLPCWKDVWQTSVFDDEYTPLYVKGKFAPDVTPLQFLTSSGKSPIQVIPLIQSGGIWIANGKASITWNLKQVIVRKPKTSAISDDTCFLTVKCSDLEALKTEPQPEIEHNDHSVSALVEDSDGEEEYCLPPPEPAPVVAPVAQVVAPPEPAVAPVAQADEPAKKKRVISKKKPDA